jgi:predicted nucleic acid-binding protein
MSRVVLDTNVVVSALSAPAGTQATVLMLAFTGHVALYVSIPVLPSTMRYSAGRV